MNVCGAAAVNYPGLPALCRAAHRNGMLTSTVAGSGRLAAAQLDWLRFSIDLLGVELEGGPRARQRRRCMPRAQQAISERLKAVRAAGIPFAMVFPLSAKTIANLEWAASTAVSEGAAMLQVRPAPEMSPEEMAEAWDETERVCELERGNLVIHIDTVNPCNLPAEPPDLAAWKQAVEAGARHLGARRLCGTRAGRELVMAPES